MVFRGAATFIVRLSRTLISRPAKPIFTSSIHQTSKFTKHPTRFYLFPSIYRSFLAPTNAQNVSSNLVPFRLALDDIKRRLFFAGSYVSVMEICRIRLSFVAPRGSHLLLGLLGYSLLPQSSYDQGHFDKTLHQIGSLLSKSSMMDQFSQEDEKHYQTVLDNYELGRLIGCGCNAAVYEARLRSSNSQSDESDIEILSQHSSNSTDVESFTEGISIH